MKSAVKFLENVKQSMNIGLVFGESREIGRKTIIPVAHISYGMGHGEGNALPGNKSSAGNFVAKSVEANDSRPTEGDIKTDLDSDGVNEETKSRKFSAGATGEGFGGGFKARPIGIFQITEDKTIFFPVFSAKQVLMVAITLFWMLKRKKRKKRK